MPQYFAPKNVGIHRLAGVALFRALLSQCRRLPLEAEHTTTLANVIRHRFKARREEQSWRVLVPAWQAGYTALDLFDKSLIGDASSLEWIRKYLSQIPEHLRRPPKVAPLLPETKPVPQPRPAPESILARPRPFVSGRRRVPILTFGNKIPFLRIKKPQPHSLSALLRKRERVQMRRVYLLEHYENMLNTGAMEDQWDSLIKGQDGVQSVIAASELRSTETGGCHLHHIEGIDGSWRTEYIALRKLIKQAQEQWVKKRMAHGLELMRIVEEEGKLAAKEKAERIERKRREWWARKGRQLP